MKADTKYRRGDLSPCGTMRFWNYQSHVRKDGRKSERWIPVNQFDAHRRRDSAAKEACAARSQFYKEKRLVPKVDPKEYLWKTYGIR